MTASINVSQFAIEKIAGVYQPIASLQINLEGERFYVHLGNPFRLHPVQLEKEERTLRLRCACGGTWGLRLKPTTMVRRCVCSFRHKVTVQRVAQ